MEDKEKSFVGPLVLLVVIVILISGGIYLYKKYKDHAAGQAIALPADWKTYTNEKFDYKIGFPANLPIDPDRSSSTSSSQTDFGDGSLNFVIRITKDPTSADQVTKNSEATLAANAAAAGFTATDTISNVTIGGIEGKKISIQFTNLNGTASHVLNTAYIVKDGNQMLFGCFYEPIAANLPASLQGKVTPDDLNTKYGYDCSTFDKMLSTFQFTK